MWERRDARTVGSDETGLDGAKTAYCGWVGGMRREMEGVYIDAEAQIGSCPSC